MLSSLSLLFTQFLMHVEQLQLQHLELPICEVIDYCMKVECFEGLHLCSQHDSLAVVIEKFVAAQVRCVHKQPCSVTCLLVLRPG